MKLRSRRGDSARRRWTSAITVGGLLVAMLPATAIIASEHASAATGDPDHVNTTIEGCNNDGSITLPDGSGNFVCPTADYTTGNLGKGWNELDLVPYRVTFTTGGAAPASQTYTVAIAGDYSSGGHLGYDVISVPVLNTSLSSASCTAAVTGAQTTTSDSATIYRKLTITQNRNTTCVYDYYMRLALGAHLYPGSSLHGYLLNQNLTSSGIGEQDIPIPVKEILPQSLSKDMSASQNSDHLWDIVKSPTPATVPFANTCAPDGARTASVQVTVTWTKEPAVASGPISYVTHVYATNPASRVITTNVSDQIYGGTSAIGSPAVSGPIDVAAGHTILVLTHSGTVPAGTTNLNDIATATYTDKVTGVAVPGTTTAHATATLTTGSETNASAVITDTESITGPFQFSTDSTTGATGTFSVLDGATPPNSTSYTLGDPIDNAHQLQWVSGTQTDSGSVTFNKTVYVEAATVGSGQLSDTATASNGSTTLATDTAHVDVTADATTSLGVTKTTSLHLAGAETFTFHLIDAGTGHDTGQTVTVTIPANGVGPVDSSLISGLSPTGSYYFHEDGTAPYVPQDSDTKTFSLVQDDITSCSASIPVDNRAGFVHIRVKKDTIPTGNSLWTFTLSDNGSVVETLTNVPANNESTTNPGGWVPFTTLAQNDTHTYTITEVPQSGYDLTGIDGDLSGDASRVTTNTTALTCSFTLNLVTDSDKTFECAYTNTQRGSIRVVKNTNPSGSTQSFTFTPTGWDGGTTFDLTDGHHHDSGDLVPSDATHSYSVAETVPSGWDQTGASCDHGTPGDITVLAGQMTTCTFTNTQRGTIRVIKNTVPSGSGQSFTFDPSGWDGGTSFDLTDGTHHDSGDLVPSDAHHSYSVAETVPDGWAQTGASCDHGTPGDITVLPGQRTTCTFTNTQQGTAKVIKTVNGQPPSGSQSFNFTLRTGASTSSDGTVIESGTANAGNGGVIQFSTYLVPGDTYQLCEEIPAPGWATSLPNQYTIPNSGSANTIVCTDFTVSAGDNKVFNVDNTPPPGGNAFTIGYWKTHASCSTTGARKTPSLDRTLYASDPTGVSIGTLTLHGGSTPDVSPDCLKAIRLLNKSTTDTNKKMASNPLYNLAAQLLAAKLNIVAGAGSCPAANSAISAGQALLVKYSFNGTGNYSLTKSDAALANSLANTLDQYNNNTLC